jgi:dimethylargininase
MVIALTRAVSPLIEQCELTHLERAPIDFARAVAEHDQYEELLRRLGCRVERLPDAPELPDSVFVEDTAVVFDDLAVIARPGAASRQPEIDAMVQALRPHRRLQFIESPGALDGGDVLVTSPPHRAGVRGGDPGPGRVFVGLSGRTNDEGMRQLASHVAPYGFDVIGVPVTGCLHLKSAVTLVDASTLLINAQWIDPSHFDGFDLIHVDPSEPAAANVLRIGDTVICAAEFPQTRRRLEANGFVTAAVPAGELAKAEGGVTCCSVLVTTIQ